MTHLLAYLWRIFPGIGLLYLVYILFPNKKTVLKMFLLIFSFILMRDAMTPLGFWHFGATKSIIWLRFIDDSLILFTLAVVSLASSIALYMYDSELKARLVWFTHSSKIKVIFVSLLMPIMVILPFSVFYFATPISQRGGEVPLSILPSLLLFSLLGNFLEELLFRGYVQSYLREQRIGRWRRMLLSGLFFSAGHIFLASTVTDLGIIILLFTFWEGFICAVVYEKYGIISATLTHGLSIFLLSSGFF